MRIWIVTDVYVKGHTANQGVYDNLAAALQHVGAAHGDEIDDEEIERDDDRLLIHLTRKDEEEVCRIESFEVESAFEPGE